MASETATPTDTRTQTGLEPWQAGLTGGLAGGLIFGVMMTMQMEMIVEMAIRGCTASVRRSPSGGRSTCSTRSFSASSSLSCYRRRELGTDSVATSPSPLRAAYGVVLWVVLASFVMPAWVGAMTEMAPPVPDWNGQSLMGHAVYGVILGLLYALLAR